MMKKHMFVQKKAERTFLSGRQYGRTIRAFVSSQQCARFLFRRESVGEGGKRGGTEVASNIVLLSWNRSCPVPCSLDKRFRQRSGTADEIRFLMG